MPACRHVGEHDMQKRRASISPAHLVGQVIVDDLVGSQRSPQTVLRCAGASARMAASDR